jgi:hypothetical protein
MEQVSSPEVDWWLEAGVGGGHGSLPGRVGERDAMASSDQWGS